MTTTYDATHVTVRVGKNELGHPYSIIFEKRGTEELLFAICTSHMAAATQLHLGFQKVLGLLDTFEVA